MVFNVTFNNTSVISWRPILLVEETGVPGENHRTVASHWHILLHIVVSSTPRHERGFELTTIVMTGMDCTGSCKSNYHTITTTTAPLLKGIRGDSWQARKCLPFKETPTNTPKKIARCRKSLKIPKGWSESITRRINNTMTNRVLQSVFLCTLSIAFSSR